MKGLVISLIGAVVWGITPTVVKLGLATGLSPLAGTFISMAVAVPVLGLVLGALGQLREVSKFDLKTLLLVSLAGIGAILGVVCYYQALSLEPVARVVAVANTAPFFTMLVARLFDPRERINRPAVVGATLIFLGLTLAVFG
ncbi:MAG: hypothetical protein C4315_05225 [Chloroflexota bacterium]